ncbi:MAG: hydrogenase-4 component E [Rhodospirillaceae bacterium]
MPAIHGLAFDVAHMLAGGMVTVSFMLLFQDRLFALIQFITLHALVLSLAIGWQAWVQSADHLYATAALALAFKAMLMPLALHRLVRRLHIERSVEPVVGVGVTMLFGIGLVALSVVVMLPLAAKSPLMWEDLSFALAVIMLGLLIMISRRNPVGQIVGFLSVDNGIMLAAAGARGMPFMIELSIAFSALAALVVFGVSLSHIRKEFDSVDVHTLDRFRGDLP